MAWSVKVLLSLVLMIAPTTAAIRFPSFIASSMVFQQNVPIPLTGFDSANAQISVHFLGKDYTATADASGAWRVTLPAQPYTSAPTDIVVSSSASASVTLSDVVFGDVIVCSGQSNMELGISCTVNQSDTLAKAAQYGPFIRVLQVATLPEYYNVTSPQTDFKTSVPWSRASSGNLPYFSAMCYWYAVSLLEADPSLVFGLIDSSWGGTAMEPWMTPSSLHACGEGAASKQSSSPRLLDSGLPSARQFKGSFGVRDGPPSIPSTLFNSMIAPLIGTPINAILWYQGESNAGNPVAFARCFPQFILGWRASWTASTHGATDPNLPFLFAQLSSWPSGDNGVIAVQRYAQQSALALPKVAMTVTADIGDAGSPCHPIHPPWKAEVGRRTALAGCGPQLVAVHADAWQPSWGDYHLGFGSGVCATGAFLCMGLRLVFDQAVTLDPTFGLLHGFPSGFELFAGAEFQPAVLTGLADDHTVQLNATWAFAGNPTELLYAWHDYPIMLLANTQGQPVVPFNISLPKPQ